MKPRLWLPLVGLMFFPEEVWGGEFSAGHFVPMTALCQPHTCGFPAALLPDLCELWAGLSFQEGNSLAP